MYSLTKTIKSDDYLFICAECLKLKTQKELKGTHTVYFSSSLYIINQKPMIHRTDFHCITLMGCMFFWVKFGNAFAYFVVSCPVARWRYYSNKFLFRLQDQIVPYSSWQARENIFLHKKVSIFKVYSMI